MPQKKVHPQDKRSDKTRPTVRSATIQKSAKDGGFTPTEMRKRNQLLKQFSGVSAKGYEIRSGTSKEFRDNYDAVFAKDDEETK